MRIEVCLQDGTIGHIMEGALDETRVRDEYSQPDNVLVLAEVKHERGITRQRWVRMAEVKEIRAYEKDVEPPKAEDAKGG